MNENPVTLEFDEAPAVNALDLAHERRLKKNLDWLNARWDDLLPRTRGKFVAVAGQEVFIADTYQEAMDLARAAHPDDDAAWGQRVPEENENFITFDVETDPDGLARSKAQDERFKRNSDWLQGHWPDLLPQAIGRYLTVAGRRSLHRRHTRRGMGHGPSRAPRR